MLNELKGSVFAKNCSCYLHGILIKSVLPFQLKFIQHFNENEKTNTFITNPPALFLRAIRIRTKKRNKKRDKN